MQLNLGLLTLLSTGNNAHLVTEDTTDTPVAILASCKGVDFAKLSIKADGFSAHMLQESYNKVHEETDNGDSFLTDLHFDHASKKKGETLGWYSWGSYYGGWHCNLCPPDDDGTAGMLSGSGAALRAWEAEFAAGLVRSKHEEFGKVKTCEIKIMPKPAYLETLAAEASVQDEEEETDTPVAVLATCDGVDFSKLSIKADGFSAKVLRNSYNKVHEETDNGDSYLTDLHFDHASKKRENTLGWYSWGSYYGGWHCNLCPPDDDGTASMVSGSGSALRAWEAEFAAGLVRSKHEEFGKVKTCEIKIMPKPAYLATLAAEASVQDEEEETDTPVAVLATCDGVDFSKLSIKADGFSAKVLRNSYNKVHEETDNGDSYLTDLHFDHASKKRENTLGWYSWGSYYGGWHCNLCPPDDDGTASMVSGSGSALRAWEAEFAAGLVSSKHEEFAKVKTCEIKIMPKPAYLTGAEIEEVGDDTSDAPIAIKAECDGVDFSKLSIKADGYAAKAMQKSYNKVHEETDNGDSFLTHIHFDHASKKKRTVSGVRGATLASVYDGWFYGGWHCNLCPPDDDATAGIVGGSGAALRAWEAEFLEMLVESGHDEFTSAEVCQIKITAKPTTATTAALA